MSRAPRARPPRAWLLAAALAAFVPSLAGCRRDIHLLSLAEPDGGQPGGGLGDAGGGTGGAGGADGAAPACSGLGDPIVLPTMNGGATCAGALSARAHRFALCSCYSLNLGVGLRTDAFDSTNSGVNDAVSGAVGTDGALTTLVGAQLRVGGAIYAAGSDGVLAGDNLQAGASLRSGGPLNVAPGNADLMGDAYVDGDVYGNVKVSGTLYVPATAEVGSGVQAQAVSTATVSVPAPCDCSDGFVDVAGAITAAMGSSGDAAAGFGPDTLAMVSSAAQLTLGCGSYFLNAINATAPVTLAVHGRALLAVATSVNLGAGLTVTLDPSAELDLLVNGWINVNGGTVGAPSAPARFRIWNASTDSLTFDNQPTIAAVVHAPNSVANAQKGLTLSGSLFVQKLVLGDDAALHFDRAILSSGVECGEPAAAPVP